MSCYIELVSIPKEDFEEMLKEPCRFREWKLGFSKEDYSYIYTNAWEDIERMIVSYKPILRSKDIIHKIFHSGVFLGEDLTGDYSNWYYEYLTPDEVKELSAKLANITEQELRKIFDADSMECADAFPLLEEEDTDVDPETDVEGVFDYMMQEYEKVKEFYTATAKSGNAVISFRLS